MKTRWMVLRIDMKQQLEECKLRWRITKKKPIKNCKELWMLTLMKCAKLDKRSRSRMMKIALISITWEDSLMKLLRTWTTISIDNSAAKMTSTLQTFRKELDCIIPLTPPRLLRSSILLKSTLEFSMSLDSRWRRWDPATKLELIKWRLLLRVKFKLFFREIARSCPLSRYLRKRRMLKLSSQKQ